jgi:transposase-like protein
MCEKGSTPMSKTRRNHGSAFKARVALEALEGEQTAAAIAAKHGLHPTLVNEWKRQLADGASAVFEKGTSKAEKDDEALVGELYTQISQQKVELDSFVQEVRQLGRTERRAMVDRAYPTLSVSRQCQILGVSRASVYYRPAEVSDENLTLMALIDHQYIAQPSYGSRQMTAWLNTQGHAVNRKRVQRLMRLTHRDKDV